MKFSKIIALLLLSVFFACGKGDSHPVITPPDIEQPGPTPEEQITEAEWEVVAVSDAIQWKYFHFKNLFHARQSVTVIVTDLNKGIRVDIPYVTSGFLKTSEAGTRNAALAAINGSFFNTKTGGSTVFFKKDGNIVNDTRSGFTPYRENAGFTIDADGRISIVHKPVLGWRALEVPHALASGPLLLLDGKVVEQLDVDFNNDRHPRTAIGLAPGNRLIAAVVDGRASESAGMNIEELTTLMQALGCTEAMNLDGGGSSTAWIQNHGVVNYPSDNNTFDHEGERGVATVIVVKEKQQLD